MGSHWALPLLIGVLVIGLAVTTPHFLSTQNLTNILIASSTLVILAVGAALVIGAGGIDLSIGAMMALATSAASTFVLTMGLGAPWMIALCLILGAGIGAINGFLAATTLIPPFIITLAIMSIARGLAYVCMDGQLDYGLDPMIVWLGQGTVLGLPVPILLAILVTLAAHIVLRRTRLGAHLCAYGDAPRAAHAMGINVYRLKIMLYAGSGVTGAIAGLIYSGRLNTIDPSAGLMIELAAITAAIIGGAHLAGGRTSIIGAALGALLMATLQNGLHLHAISGFYQSIVIGLVLLVAVALRAQGRS
jgi:ribose/xylose/arabinose/galactoside ABC-type transport system permease subunit